MEHLVVRSVSRRVLLVDVHASADGQGVGYGMMLIRMNRALLLAHMAGMALFFVPTRHALNTTVTRLQSPDVTVIPESSWYGRLLTAVWRLSAPFRAGAPGLWLRAAIAHLVLARCYPAVERATWLAPRVRRLLLRQGPLFARLKRVRTTYAARTEASWDRRYRRDGIARLREREQRGEPGPDVRLMLPADQERRTVDAARALGIDPARPVVTVHVREGGYRAIAGLRQRGWDDIRNARIETFAPAFAALVERGYTVVRLGDPTMTPVTVPGVVDLATSAARDPWLDIWCTQRSEFLIGCDSGPSWLAVLLGVPILTVNAVHFRDVKRPADRMLCKLARDRQTGTILSVSEMLTPEFLREGFKGGRYEPVDNSAEDIRRAALDMIEVVHGREQRTSWQSRFNRRLREAERGKWSGRSALEGVVVFGRARGTLSRTFAKRYYLPPDDPARVPKRARREPPDVTTG